MLKYLLLLLLALGSLPLAQASAPSRRTPLLKRWKPRCHALKGKITQRLPVARRLGKKSHQPWRSSHARRCYAPLLTTAPPPPSHRRGRFHHWNARPNRRLALTMLLGSSLGGTAYWLQSNPVTARGYDDGLYSIVAFQTTLQAFTEPDLDTLDPLACTALHQAATHLLFEIQAKIIQCRALSKATGYPLFKPDFQAYRKVRCETEALIRKLCARHDDLPKIGDMQTLEDAFFDKEGKEEEQTLGSCLIGFCKGGGEAIIYTPVRFVDNITGLISGIGWWLSEVSDDFLNQSNATKETIRRYGETVDDFAHQYKQNGLRKGDPKAMGELVDLVLTSYNLLWYLNVWKSVWPNMHSKLARQVCKARKPLFDEFCLVYNRKWLPNRFMQKLSDMSPAQRTEFITHLVTSFVADVLFLDFVADIAGLGDLQKLGKKSKIGRWLSKTRGGRKTFQKLRKLHQARNKVLRKLLLRGIHVPTLRIVALKEEEQLLQQIAKIEQCIKNPRALERLSKGAR
ncbi:MAG: hypothetical protein ACPGC9_01790, partial [Cytophagales bacterium]